MVNVRTNEQARSSSTLLLEDIEQGSRMVINLFEYPIRWIKLITDGLTHPAVVLLSYAVESDPYRD